MNDESSKMQQNEIIFRMGEETGIVIERENFSKSLFKEHYVKALRIVDDIIRRPQQDANSNVIAFCADRGEGKTSCMRTVAEILSSTDIYKRFKNEFTEIKGLDIHPEALLCLDVIDPAYFDEKHNIVELIVGMMYEHIKTFDISKKCSTDEKVNITSKFREVQKSLEYIEKASLSEAPVYDPLEKIESLSRGLVLPNIIQELMREFLSIIGKERMIICIDDIDLNIQYAYQMTEQIRKYLSNDRCIILFATNVEQLTMVIRHSMEKELYGRIVESEKSGCQEMAAKYVTKLLPTSQRINLVHITDLYDRQLVIEGNGEDNDIDNTKKYKVKDIISQLIYAKTRYLFYNNESETSPIVPRNLRSFRHLMKLLTDMPDFNNVQIRMEISEPSEKQLKKYNEGLGNKAIFKDYFYQVWVTNNLSKRDAEFAKALVEYTDVSGINLFVIQYLKNKFGINIGTSIVDRNMSSEDQAEFKNLLNLTEEEVLGNEIDERLEQGVNPTLISILDKQNKAYNVTLGDVFYLLSYLQKSYISTEDKLLLFFIKSFYSIRLYEYYDMITEQKGTIYPRRVELGDRVSIYRVDETYKNTNILQRFINGSFVTYLPNEFLPNDKKKRMPRDLRLINAKEIKTLFAEVIAEFSTKKTDEDYKKVTEEWRLKFQMCEFLCWTISRTSYAHRNSKNIDIVSVDRKQNTPLYYGEFRPKATLYVLDIFAPFYNAVNIEYTYNRIDNNVNFYEMAKKYPDSLLNNAIRATLIDRKKQDVNIDEKEIEKLKTKVLTPTDYYTMLSGAIIRNADVLVSLREHMSSKKEEVSKDGGANTLQVFSQFYKEIIRTEMYTYQTKDDSNYEIRFSFFDAIVSFLNELVPARGKELPVVEAEMDRWFSNLLFEKPQKTSQKEKKKAKDSLNEMVKEETKKKVAETIAEAIVSPNDKNKK